MKRKITALMVVLSFVLVAPLVFATEDSTSITNTDRITIKFVYHFNFKSIEDLDRVMERVSKMLNPELKKNFSVEIIGLYVDIRGSKSKIKVTMLLNSHEKK